MVEHSLGTRETRVRFSSKAQKYDAIVVGWSPTDPQITIMTLGCSSMSEQL